MDFREALVGTACWSASYPNGEMLQLECGERREYIARTGEDVGIGSIGIVVDSRAWTIEIRGVVYSADSDQVWEAMRTLESTITEVVVDDRSSLRITFASGATLEAPGVSDCVDDDRWDVIFADGSRVSARDFGN